MTSTQKTIRIIDGEPSGRLDRALATHIAELSRTRLKGLIEAGSVAVDGRTTAIPATASMPASPSLLTYRSPLLPSPPPRPFR